MRLSIHFLSIIFLMFILILSSHLRLGRIRGLPVKIWKELLSFCILATFLAHLNLLDLITLTILGERYKLCKFLTQENFSF